MENVDKTDGRRTAATRTRKRDHHNIILFNNISYYIQLPIRTRYF